MEWLVVAADGRQTSPSMTHFENEDSVERPTLFLISGLNWAVSWCHRFELAVCYEACMRAKGAP